MPDDELQELRARLAEAEAVIAALRSGEVDAIVGEHQVTLVRLREAEDELRRERARLETVLRRLPAGVVIAEAPSGRLILGNAQVKHIWRKDFIPSEGIEQYDAYKGFHSDGRPYRADEWPLARTLATGEPVEEEVRFQRGDGSFGWMLANAAPILDADGRMTAAVVIFTDISERKHAEDELRRLNDTLEQRVTERTGMLQLLNDVAAAANEARNVEEAIAYTLKRVGEYNGWNFGHAYLLEEGDPVTLVPVRTFYEAAPGRFRPFREATLRTRLRSGQGLPGRVLDSKSVQWADDIGLELGARRAAIGVELGIRCGAAFPIFSGDEVVGVLEFFSDKRIERTDRLLDSMTGIGTQLGRVVERQRFERDLARVLLAEQQRIAQDLHDAVGQEIAGLALIAEQTARRARNGSPPGPEALQDWVESLRHALEGTRAVVRDLLPPAVSHAGALVAALQELAADVSQHYNVICEIESSGPVAVELPEVAAHLYRIAAEAVTNAARHARARRITLRLSFEDDMLVLTVQDDGEGIPRDPGTGGSGLRIMQHRANVIGASLEVRCPAEGGTIVTCALPEAQLGGSEGEEA